MNFSKQRESILRYLKNTREHPTAEQIYSDLKAELPNLSLATVYRNLTQLCEAGLVLRLATGGKTDRFDADVSDHQHFVCTKCGSVSDFTLSLLEEQMKTCLGDATVSHYRLYAYGVCPACAK